MSWLLVLAALLSSQAAVNRPIDVTRVKVAPPVAVASLDMGALKGEPRRLCWSPNAATLYVQTADGNPPLETFHHYSVPAAGGAPAPLLGEPDWSVTYWSAKQDRVAQGLDTLVIEVVQGTTNVKSGPGQAGVLDRSASPDSVATNNPSVDSLVTGNMGSERARVVRLTLLGVDIATWTNERPFPGARFSWGPAGSGALVFVGEKGQLFFFDQDKRKQAVTATRDARLPAWSVDGKQLAYLQKVGRKKYSLMIAGVEWER